jgi:hypothetical protein
MPQPNESPRPEALQTSEQNRETKEPVDNSKIFIRLPSSYIPFFQAMAEDYYKRGRIPKPSIGLLTKKCLIMAGNSWNRMMVQLKSKELEQERQTIGGCSAPTSEYQQ